eukprot:gene9239-biopygen8570
MPHTYRLTVYSPFTHDVARHQPQIGGAAADGSSVSTELLSAGLVVGWIAGRSAATAAAAPADFLCDVVRGIRNPRLREQVAAGCGEKCGGGGGRRSRGSCYYNAQRSVLIYPTPRHPFHIMVSVDIC